jgi:hypothetical protein
MDRDWPAEWPLQRIDAAAQAADAAYIPVEPVRLVPPWTGPDPIEPRTIISVGGMFLVEAVGDPDDWYMGQRAPDGRIECWGQYGDIESALRAL